MGATAAIKLRSVRRNLETVLALEVFCAAQAIDLRQKRLDSAKKLGVGTEPLYNAIRAKIPFIGVDEYMKDHIDAAVKTAKTYARTGGF